MTYSETLDYLNSYLPAFHLQGASAFNAGLDNISALLEASGNPHRCFPSVHVAGTNGKGSTSHLIAAALMQSGMRVGLYTSPHLADYCERIRVDGLPVDKQYVIDFVENNRALIEEIKPSFFEVTTALAFSYFASSKVDIAVVEVGLGRRLDSTNVITPLLSVITNIGLDHTDLLGDTPEKIAAEKAGIIKHGVPVVIGETDEATAPVFINKARETEAQIVFADQQPQVSFDCQLKGDYQQHNIQTAYYALQVLSNHLPALQPFDLPNVSYAFRHVVDMTGLRGRWEVLREKPFVVCDTGHNSHGLKYVFTQLQTLHRERNKEGRSVLRIVFGRLRDKDVDEVVGLLPDNAVYYITQPSSMRAMPAVELAEKIKKEGRVVHCFGQVSPAMGAALKDAGENDIIFIGGSIYIVGTIIETL